MIDPCLTNPCIHGTCTPYATSYKCTCSDGFTGRNCDVGHAGNVPFQILYHISYRLFKYHFFSLGFFKRIFKAAVIIIYFSNLNTLF